MEGVTTGFRDNMALLMHGFQFPASRAVRQHTSAVLSHLACGTLLWPSMQLTQGGGNLDLKFGCPS